MTILEKDKLLNNIIDLSNLKNIPSLSIMEQKNLAILVVARNELSRLLPLHRDSFSNLILEYLVKNAPDFKELESLFDKYYSETNPIKKSIIFKQIKPIEPLAVFLSEIAIIFNKTEKSSELTIKGFVYNLILDWFKVEKMESRYLSELISIDFQSQIDKLIKRTKENPEARAELHVAFDNSIEISQFLKKFRYTLLIPDKCIKGKRKVIRK